MVYGSKRKRSYPLRKIILFLLINTAIFSQDLLLLYDSGYKNPETTIYLQGQTVTGTQANRIDRLISMLKDSLSITSLSSF